MKSVHTIDEARLGILLNELRLPTIKTLWPQFAEQADREGWPAARFLSTIAEHELAERANRRVERHLAEAHLPPGKTLDSFAFDAVPMVSKAQVTAITAGDSWLAKGANVLMFGPPGGGKSHLAAAIGLALIENGWRVLFTRTTDLVQKLQVARRELQTIWPTSQRTRPRPACSSNSSRHDMSGDQLCSPPISRSENGMESFQTAMTLAAVDRLVHHATIFEMNVESYRRRSAMEAKRQRGRPASFATIKGASQFVAERQSEDQETLVSGNQHDNFIPTAT
jgi:DNA replication protein DnaC